MIRRPKRQMIRCIPEYEYEGYFIQQHASDLYVILDDEHKEIGKASSLEKAQAWIDAEQTGEHDQFVGPSG